MITLRTADWLYNAGLAGLMRVCRQHKIPYRARGNTFTIEEKELGALATSFGSFFYTTAVQRYRSQLTWERQLQGLKRIAEHSPETLQELSEESYGWLFRPLQAAQQRNKHSPMRKVLEAFEGGELLLNAFQELPPIPAFEHRGDSGQLLDGVRKVLDVYEGAGIERRMQAHDVAVQLQYPMLAGGFYKQLIKGRTYTENLTKMVGEPVFYHLEEKQTKGFKKTCTQCGQGLPSARSRQGSLNMMEGFGIDTIRKSSMFWDETNPYLLCAICSMVHTCAPIGFHALSGEGVFVNDNQKLERLYQVNVLPLQEKQYMAESEGRVYEQLAAKAQSTLIKQEHANQNVQVVRLDIRSSPRYTIHSSRSEELALIEQIKDDLWWLKGSRIPKEHGSSMQWVSLHGEVLHALLKGVGLKAIRQRLMEAQQRHPDMLRREAVDAFHWVYVSSTCYQNGMLEQLPEKETIRRLGEAGRKLSEKMARMGRNTRFERSREYLRRLEGKESNGLYLQELWQVFVRAHEPLPPQLMDQTLSGKLQVLLREIVVMGMHEIRKGGEKEWK